MFKKILTFLNHERYQVVAGVFCLFIIFIVVSCRSKTQSILHPEKKITRAELIAEIEFVNKIAESRLDELDNDSRLLSLILEQSLLLAETGGLNLNGLIPLVFSVFGVGAVVDNARKRRDIKRLTNAGESK